MVFLFNVVVVLSVIDLGIKLLSMVVNWLFVVFFFVK